jgi:hypothetical protein
MVVAQFEHEQNLLVRWKLAVYGLRWIVRSGAVQEILGEN